jgi:hypothetical protein
LKLEKKDGLENLEYFFVRWEKPGIRLPRDWQSILEGVNHGPESCAGPLYLASGLGI